MQALFSKFFIFFASIKNILQNQKDKIAKNDLFSFNILQRIFMSNLFRNHKKVIF